MNDSPSVTRRQFFAAVFAALLSPMMRLVPRACAALGGRGAWLSVFPAGGVLLIFAVLMCSLLRAMRPGEGMAELILRIFGNVAGRIILILYGVWFLFYAGFTLRSGAERLASAVYRQSGATPFILVMLALCLPAALGTLRAAARTGFVLRRVLLAVLGISAALALPNIRWSNLFPLRADDMLRAASAGLPIAAVGGCASLFSFLSGASAPETRTVRQYFAPLALFLAVALLLCFETVGSYGAALTARLSYPFFTMIRDVTLLGTAQRIEAGVIAVWVFADFILCTLLLRCAQEALRTCFSLPKYEPRPGFVMRRGGWLIWPEAAAVFLFSQIPPASAQEFFFWSERLIPVSCACISYGGFFLIWLVGKLRKRI